MNNKINMTVIISWSNSRLCNDNKLVLYLHYIKITVKLKTEIKFVNSIKTPN